MRDLFRAPSRLRLPRGVTLLEVVVTVAILGILGSVIVVGVETSSRLGGEAKRIDDAAFVLAKLRDASVRYNLGTFLRDTSFTAKIGGTATQGGVNPGRLSHLTKLITTSDFNSCGFAYTPIQVTAWVRNFYSSPISSSTPFQIAGGFYADDTLARYDSTGTPTHLASGDANILTAPGTLAIVMRNVAISDAMALAARMEGDQSGGNSSIVRFTPNGTAPVTVYYHMEIHGC
jgi:prepilin-type N-terminal cleavage/methylation domain-containing protein